VNSNFTGGHAVKKLMEGAASHLRRIGSSNQHVLLKKSKMAGLGGKEWQRKDGDENNLKIGDRNRHTKE